MVQHESQSLQVLARCFAQGLGHRGTAQEPKEAWGHLLLQTHHAFRQVVRARHRVQPIDGERGALRRTLAGHRECAETLIDHGRPGFDQPGQPVIRFPLEVVSRLREVDQGRSSGVHYP